MERSRKYAAENNVHLLPDDGDQRQQPTLRGGCQAAGFTPEQFPVNVKGCRGSSLCNLGCPNGAKQGTHKVQLPAAEAGGVEVVTRADVLEVGDRQLKVRVRPKPAGSMGNQPDWEPGDYLVKAEVVVLAGGVLGTVPLLLHSGFGLHLPKLGQGFTCHPAFILVAEHPEEITNDVGHPKSFFVDRGVEEGFVLETCMYFPFVTAKNLTGFGPDHAAFMNAYPRLQMILVLACDKAVPQNRVACDRGGNPVVHYRFTPAVSGVLGRGHPGRGKDLLCRRGRAGPCPSGRSSDRLERAEVAPDRRVPDPGQDISSRDRFLFRQPTSWAGPGWGVSIEDSVTDSWGRVHGYPWLRVADASLFPDSLEINPYLTIMALADRVAEGVCGGPFVKRTGRDLVVKALEDEGIPFTFGIPGTHNIELYDALAGPIPSKPSSSPTNRAPHSWPTVCGGLQGSWGV